MLKYMFIVSVRGVFQNYVYRGTERMLGKPVITTGMRQTTSFLPGKS